MQKINSVRNAMEIMSLKTDRSIKNLNQGKPLEMKKECGRYDTVELSVHAKLLYDNSIRCRGHQSKETDVNAKPHQITHEALAKVDLSASKGKWVVTLYTDGRVEDPIAEYNRSQGNYFGDVFNAAMGIDNGAKIYQDAISKGMSKEQAWELQKQGTTDRFRNNFDEALALVHKFVPLSTEADGQPIEYSDVYDKNGNLTVPAKVSPIEYQKNLQSIIDNMMSYLEQNQSRYPKLYNNHFGS